MKTIPFNAHAARIPGNKVIIQPGGVEVDQWHQFTHGGYSCVYFFNPLSEEMDKSSSDGIIDQNGRLEIVVGGVAVYDVITSKGVYRETHVGTARVMAETRGDGYACTIKTIFDDSGAVQSIEIINASMPVKSVSPFVEIIEP